MKGNAHLALVALLTFAVMMAWLNATHLLEAVIAAQPGVPPTLSVEGIRLLPKGLHGPIVAPITGLLFSAGIAFTLAFRNLVVTDRPWLRMGMFVGLIAGVLVCWVIFGMKLSFVNPSDASDPEIAEITKSGFLALNITFIRGSEPVTASFVFLLTVYSALVAVFASPEWTKTSSEQGVRRSLRS